MKRFCLFVAATLLVVLVNGCATAPAKKYFTLNYSPDPLSQRLRQTAYPVTFRIREFNVEEAYARPQLVYRQSPYEVGYYYYRVWAIKPTRMITDLVIKHIATVGLIDHVVRRMDEGFKPQYDLTGVIEALEEYDNDEVWFAHMALRLNLIRLSDNKTVYSRRFDKRKQVHQHEPEYVIRELSEIMDMIMTEAVADIDQVLLQETSGTGSGAAASPETSLLEQADD